MANKPRNITPQLSRATVTICELASLGWLHATVARLHSALGIGWRRDSDESNGELFDMGHKARHRLDTSSLRIEAEWPKALIKLGIGAVAAVAMITTLTLAEPARDVPAAVPIEQIRLTPTTLPDTDEPSVKAVVNPMLDRTPKAYKRSQKKHNRKAQKRRSR